MDSELPQDDTINSLPSEWLPLINLWLRRAADLASVPGYDGRGIRSIFEDEVVENQEFVDGRILVDKLEEIALSEGLDDVQNNGVQNA